MGKLIGKLTCRVKGHTYDGLYDKIDEAAKFVATWANAYNATGLVAHIHGDCSRCGHHTKDPIARVEGYLIDDRWVTMTDRGVLTL